ncbi:hypothetical protein HanPSC8_Chr10g0445421 [Helianthus annuus]|nr:hypothetical protein HanPSC8_Chr10g0445421 [Helianthus annuus]
MVSNNEFFDCLSHVCTLFILCILNNSVDGTHTALNFQEHPSEEHSPTTRLLSFLLSLKSKSFAIAYFCNVSWNSCTSVNC